MMKVILSMVLLLGLWSCGVSEEKEVAKVVKEEVKENAQAQEAQAQEAQAQEAQAQEAQAQEAQAQEVQAQEVGTFTDSRDGEIYKTVRIGDQVWMSENLRYNISGSYLNPNNPSKKYGRLYTWNQALEACPSGWHLPSDQEWKKLERSLGMSESDVNIAGLRGNIGGKLKAVSGWNDNLSGESGNGSNSSGFNAMPAGFYLDGSFLDLGRVADFWSSVEESSDYSWRWRLFHKDDGVGWLEDDKSNGYSCRCLKN